MVSALLVLYVLLLLIVRRAERARHEADASLRSLMSELEARVAERTTELTAANAKMHEEVNVRRRAETKLESKRDLLITQQFALSAVLKSEQFRGGALDDALRLITETAAQSLSVARVSIWRLNSSHDAIDCLDLYELGASRHSNGVQLLRADYPRYFAALVAREEIIAHDAHSDPRTNEFSANYLTPLGIGSMLDAPIVRKGEVVGVICIEHVGAPTAWSPEQRLFAVAVSNLVALALEQSDSAHKERQLHEATSRLSADIEDRKRIERELRNSQRMMQSLLHSTSEGFWYIDNAANTVDVNPAMCALLGRSREQILGRNIFEFVDAANADVFRTEIEARKHGHVGPYEVALQRPDGSNVPCLNNATPIHDESGNKIGSVGLWVDISQIKHTQGQLERAKDDALAASRAKSAFLAAMSHEIRTPLNGIVSIIEILSDGDLRQEQRFQIGLARQAAAQLLNLIGNVLDLSKLESERLELESIAFELDEVIQGAADTFAVEAARKGLQLIVETERLECKLMGDPTRLKQIVLNLIGNAIKFTAHGEVAVHARCSTIEGMARVELEVADTGIGIAPDVLPKLTEKFVQASSTTSREYGGSGLGLAICKQLAEAMGGTFRIESELGKGSKFCVSLQLTLAPRVVASPPVAGSSIGKQRAATIVAGNPRLAASWSALLRSEALDVRAVESLAAAVDCPSDTGDGATETRTLRAMIVDEAMLQELTAQPPGPMARSVVAIISATFDATRLQALSERIAHIIVKPLTRAKLRDTLAQIDAITVPAAPQREAKDSASSNASSPQGDNVDTRVAATPASTTPAGTTAESTAPLGGLALVVEDNPTNRYVVREHLKRLGWSVQIAEDGELALPMAASERYDVILMDVFMPKLDGLETTRRIRAAAGPNQHTPIFALTANAFAEDVRACLDSGMNGHLAKPISRPALAAVLQGLVPDRAGDQSTDAPTQGSAAAPA